MSKKPYKHKRYCHLASVDGGQSFSIFTSKAEANIYLAVNSLNTSAHSWRVQRSSYSGSVVDCVYIRREVR